MFSERHEQVWAEAVEFLSERARNAAACPPFSCEGDPWKAAALLTTGGDSNRTFAAVRENARQRKQAVFNNVVFPIVPLYVTSICNEHCLYCNYRAGNGVRVERLRLGDEELTKEIEFLIHRKGFRTIELVYAADPSLDADVMCRHVELVRNRLAMVGGGQVGLNAEALDEGDYRVLLSAGLDFVVLWQETYDRDVYATMHGKETKKGDFAYRLDAFERMLSAGIGQIGIGVLSGLADWRRDWTMLFLHQAYLKSEYGVESPIIGLPRLKPAEGAIVKTTPFVPTDEQFLLAIAVQGLFDVKSLPFVNTRENWNVCREMSAGGGVLFTFNCSTTPGGYFTPRDGYQFPCFDFDVEMFDKKIESQGVNPVWNWDFAHLNQPAAVCSP